MTLIASEFWVKICIEGTNREWQVNCNTSNHCPIHTIQPFLHSATSQTVTKTYTIMYFLTVLWGIINNAGIIDVGLPLDLTTMDDYRNIYEVNLFGMVSVTLAFLQDLKKSHGRIVNMGSISSVCPAINFHSYTSSKFAVKGYNECIRLVFQHLILVCLYISLQMLVNLFVLIHTDDNCYAKIGLRTFFSISKYYHCGKEALFFQI